MRIIKLSTDEFETPEAFDHYIRTRLPARTPPGLFVCGLQLGKNGLEVGERLVFTLQAQVIYIARAASGVMDNIGPNRDQYPRCFIVDLQAARRVDVSLAEFIQRLRAAGVEARIGGRGWNTFPDSTHTENVVTSLV
jgi:hypothetical protein